MAGDPRALAWGVIQQTLATYPDPDDVLRRRAELRTKIQSDAAWGGELVGRHIYSLHNALQVAGIVDLPREPPLPDRVTLMQLRRARLVPLADAAFEYRLALLDAAAVVLDALHACQRVQLDAAQGQLLIAQVTAALATLDMPHAHYAVAHRHAGIRPPL